MSKRQLLQRGAALMLMTVQLSGCTYWQVKNLPPADVIDRHRPAEIRVQHADGGHEVLYEPAIRGDTLVGYRSWSATKQDRALALTDVTTVATRRVSAGRTARLVLGVSIVGGIVAALVGMHNMKEGNCWC